MTGALVPVGHGGDATLLQMYGVMQSFEKQCYRRWLYHISGLGLS